MRVFVYPNRNKRGFFSIKAKEGLNKNRVIAHARTVVMRDIVFQVSEAGRQRVLREKQKNVHAGVIGELVYYTAEEGTIECYAGLRHATYNPYKYCAFIDVDTGLAIYKAERAVLTNWTVYYE